MLIWSMLSSVSRRQSVNVPRFHPTAHSSGSSFNTELFLNSAGPGRTIIKFRARETAFVQGDPANSVMYIQEGGVRIAVVNSNGKEAVLAILGPGDFFGEECFAGKSSRLATAITIIPTSALVIEKHEMIRVLHEEYEVSKRFTTHLLARSSRIEADLIDQLFSPSENRLARTLLLLARKDSPDQPHKVLPKLSQETLAEMIGTTRPRVNFFINKFKKMGFIRKLDGKLHVDDSLLSFALHN
jgi:CRP/FNR family cyclic AMP-dependent transcriptional regulator